MEQARGRGRGRKPAKSSGPRPRKDQFSLPLSTPNIFISVLFSAFCAMLPSPTSLCALPLAAHLRFPLFSLGPLPVRTTLTSPSSPPALVSLSPLCFLCLRTDFDSRGWGATRGWGARSLGPAQCISSWGSPKEGAVKALRCWNCTHFSAAAAHPHLQPQPTVPTGGHLASERQSRAGGLQRSRPLASSQESGSQRPSHPFPGPLLLGSANFLLGWGP